MTPEEILLISQIASLLVQGVSALVTARKNMTNASTATEQANLASAHQNFSNVIAAATAVFSQLAQAPIVPPVA